jgi:hypothetical protein
VSAPDFPGIDDDAFVDQALAMAAKGLAQED